LLETFEHCPVVPLSFHLPHFYPAVPQKRFHSCSTASCLPVPPLSHLLPMGVLPGRSLGRSKFFFTLTQTERPSILSSPCFVTIFLFFPRKLSANLFGLRYHFLPPADSRALFSLFYGPQHDLCFSPPLPVRSKGPLDCLPLMLPTAPPRTSLRSWTLAIFLVPFYLVPFPPLSVILTSISLLFISPGPRH